MGIKPIKPFDLAVRHSDPADRRWVGAAWHGSEKPLAAAPGFITREAHRAKLDRQAFAMHQRRDRLALIRALLEFHPKAARSKAEGAQPVPGAGRRDLPLSREPGSLRKIECLGLPVADPMRPLDFFDRQDKLMEESATEVVGEDDQELPARTVRCYADVRRSITAAAGLEPEFVAQAVFSLVPAQLKDAIEHPHTPKVRWHR